VILLFTTQKKFGSRLIRWGTDSDCSHFAICFDEGEKSGIVFQSQLQSGVTISPWPDFVQHHTIVHALAPVTPVDEEAVYQAMVKMFYGKQYDWLAFTYFSLCVLRRKITGAPLPTHNQWGNDRGFLCTEIALALKDKGLGLGGKDLGIVYPHDLHTLFDRVYWAEINPAKVI